MVQVFIKAKIDRFFSIMDAQFYVIIFLSIFLLTNRRKLRLDAVFRQKPSNSKIVVLDFWLKGVFYRTWKARRFGLLSYRPHLVRTDWNGDIMRTLESVATYLVLSIVKIIFYPGMHNDQASMNRRSERLESQFWTERQITFFGAIWPPHVIPRK